MTCFMEAKIIDINDFEYAGEGANGSSYYHKQNKDIMLKLYFDFYAREFIEVELQRAKDVYDAGIPSPEPGEFVTDGKGRFGILFKRLVGKESYARIVGNNPELAEEYGRKFARQGRAFHSTKVDTSKFPNVKDQYLAMLEANNFCTPEEKAKLERIIRSAPDSDTAIHGDFHFGNILEAGGKTYFIDLGEFAYGCDLFDLGMTLIIGMLNDESFTIENFHMKSPVARRFYEAFIDEYFEGKLSLEEANELIYPYVAVKGLLVERNGNFHFNPMHEVLAKLK